MDKLNLGSLLDALKRAALAETIDTTPGVTCFAPTQDAFTAQGNPQGKLSPAELTDTVTFHTLGKATYSPDLKPGTEYPTLKKGQSIKVVRDGGSLYVEGGGGGKAKVVRGNVIVKNGVMHVIDQVRLSFSGVGFVQGRRLIASLATYAVKWNQCNNNRPWFPEFDLYWQ